MKLSRLLVSLICLLWVLVFIATLIIVVNSTKDYLQRAMESHAQDTATSLGLSITHSARVNDIGTMDTMVNAIFDRGYYREIVVKSTGGDVLVSKRVEETVKGVPDWFIAIFELQPPRMSAVVMDGWRRVAVVDVVSHPGYAYAELWRVSVRSGWVLLFVSIASFFLVIVVLRFALRPLEDMEAQALSIARREFTTLKKLPWARELQRVAIALNTMCLAVERMLGEQSELAEKMRKKAYVDEVTGLMNRNGFSEKLRHLIDAPTKFPAGVLAIVRIHGFAQYNERNGRAAGDALLQQTVRILKGICESDERAMLARLDGPQFALLVPDMLPGGIPAFGDEIIQALGAIEEFPRTDQSVMAHAGIAYYRHHEGASFGDLMSAANAALGVAHARRAPAWHVEEADASDKGAALFLEINRMFKAGLPADRVALQYQAVRACAEDQPAWAYRSEACVRILAGDGSMIRAGLFIATAKRVGALQLLDRVVMEKVMLHIAAGGPINGGATAVNVSVESITDPTFVDWLIGQLRAQPEVARQLIIEVAEHAIINSVQAVKAAFSRIREAGARLSIDRFGQSTASVGFLRSLVVDYIKVDGSYTRDIVESSDRQFFVQALVGIAHGLGIQVIVEYVETEREFAVVKTLGVDGVQGYYIGKPE